jgi:Beta xylosidase C-terminal Concanavalin A-like domain/FG-GAP-like repeat
VDANGRAASSSNATFQTSSCGTGGPVSDNFDAPALNTTLWTLRNPLSDGNATMSGYSLFLTVPEGTAHDASPSANNTLRMMQPMANVDFEVEVRFQSAVMFAQQREGIIVEQDAGNYIRFDVTHDGTTSRLMATGFAPGSATIYLNTPIASSGPPIWLRVSRSGSNWVERYSLDGVNFTSVGSFSLALSPNSIGPFSGNNGMAGIGLPAMTAVVDYFFNTAGPISNSDGPLPFSRVVIDPNPPQTTLEKALADVDGDGRLDAVIGFGNPPNSGAGQGIAWYQYPHSGNPHDPWQKYTILSGGIMYEDMVALDVNHDGAIDIIASFDGGAIYWFENPRGRGGDPRTDPWPTHFIGSGTGENNMILADIDGDGKTDIVTNAFVFFQDSPTSWTSVALPRSSSGVTLLDIGSGRGAINVVGMGAAAPFQFVWLENPREHGGNARTATWQVHVIGPAFTTTGEPATYTSADFNGDGRMDIVTASSETSATGIPSDFPIYWWEAPVDRRNGTWIRHTIDPGYRTAHNVRAADMDKNGTVDVVVAEQEQAPFRRVAIFYNDGTGNFTQQILSSGSGHSEVVGDTNGGGALDILNAGHGFFGAPHPIELYLNPRK